MLLAFLAVVAGLVILVWSADRFVEGAAITAGYAGMPPLLIGMVIVGFGTSTPEMIVSAIASLEGKPDMALGNALGSNIVNIGFILGLTALIAPITVQSTIVRRELPLLLVVCLAFGGLLWDGSLQYYEAWLLLVIFAGLVIWSIVVARQSDGDSLETDAKAELTVYAMPLRTAVFWLITGLLVLLLSSRLLVWGAVSIAQSLGISDLIIGLTIIALGTSLPELASSIMAARRGEHDIAIGNIVGSNLFNLLVVTGLAGVIHPMLSLSPALFSRDWLVMLVLTFALFLMAFGFRGKPGRINRLEGLTLLVAVLVYNGWLVISV